MLDLEPPTKEIMIEVLEGLITGKVSRTEVVEWRNSLIDKYDYRRPGCLAMPLNNDDGYWYFVSLACLTEKGPLDVIGDEYQIRDIDLSEYLSVLRGEPLPKEDRLFNKARRGEYPRKDVRCDWIVNFNDRDTNLFDSTGIFMERGVFDNLGDLMMSSGVLYKNETYLCFEKRCLYMPANSQIYGFHDTPKETICELLKFLGVGIDNDVYVSPNYDKGEYGLFRMDDNDNEFKISEHDSYIKAYLEQLEFEKHKHKQIYYVKEL